MVLKLKEKFERTRYNKNKEKSKKYILREQRNVRYFDRILTNQQKYKSYNLTKFYKFT